MDRKTAEANIGNLVYRTDNTPRPPKHHTKKVREWQRRNYSGILREVTDGYDDTGRAYISIEESRIGYKPAAIFNYSGYLTDDVHLGEHPEAPADPSIKGVE